MKSFSPSQMLVLSFALAIVGGAVLLMFPFSSETGDTTSFVDALFTSTSAVCVTGLIVKDTPAYFSTFGEIIIILLIQVGGVGIMTFSTIIALLLGRRIGLRQQLLIKEDLNRVGLGDIILLLKYVCVLTVGVELVGAFFLFFRWWRIGLGSIGHTAYLAVFHAVSAFCNAGFSLFSNSLERFSGDPIITGTIGFLIILGGIGYGVIYECIRYKKTGSLSLHTKIVILVTLVLLIGGTIVLFVCEFSNPLTLKGRPLLEKGLIAWFQSLSPRTAGFNTVPIKNMRSASQYLLMGLMFIGASPGSTAGGIKTTTFLILLLFMIATFKGKESVVLYKRTIPKDVVTRSLLLSLFSFLAVCLFVFLLLLTESFSMKDILFEAVSAFGTVGLSLGITFDLTVLGKLLITVLMFIGRIGPLALVFAMVSGKEPTVSFPEEKIMVG